MLVGIGAAPFAPDGHPEPGALIQAGVYDPLRYMSRSQLDYLKGGKRPSSLGRDLGTVVNQVPRWAWLTLGAGLLGVAYWSSR